MHALLLAAALGYADLAPSAGDNPIRQAMRNAGVWGDWSPDCSQPAGPKNLHITFAMVGSDVIETQSFGTTASHYLVTAVAPMADGRVALTETNQASGVVLTTEETFSGRQMRSWNVTRGDQFLVKDGRIVSNGAETHWVSRCD